MAFPQSMEYRMSKLFNALLAFVFAFVVISPAAAASPHFIESKTKVVINSDGGLTASFKEAGLGDAATTYTFSATVDAVWTCVTHSGKCPNAANKVTSSTTETVGGTFSPKNGTVSATMVIDAPGAPSSAPPTCGGGQHLELSSIIYSNISLADVTNGVAATNLPQTLSSIYFICP